MLIKRIPWWVAGIGLAILLVFTFSVFGANRPLGASTYVPYYAGMLFGLDPERYPYLKTIHDAGAWEGVMLLGLMLGSFVSALFVTRTFRIVLVPTGWKKYRNHSVLSRLAWSFAAGFVMIVGARLAGGCTSGHIVSGSAQAAFSSMLFGAVVLVTLVVVGKLFYRREANDV